MTYINIFAYNGKKELLIMTHTPVQLTLSIIKDKWKNRILWNLHRSDLRFNELQKILNPISKKVLSSKLQEMENHGLIKKDIYLETPLRVIYSITDLGKSLKPIFDAMDFWGQYFITFHKTSNNELPIELDVLTLSIIGDKWTDRILKELDPQPKRFAQLKKDLHPISQKVLTECLRELESLSLVQRTIYPEVPPKVEYSLTELGWSLKPLLTEMHHWGINYKKRYEKKEI